MANNPNHLNNLVPFNKGQSGNPAGRPKMPTLKDMIEDFGADEMREVFAALYKQAKKGNVRAAELLIERAYGKVKQELIHDIEAPTEINLVVCGSKSPLFKRMAEDKATGTGD